MCVILYVFVCVCVVYHDMEDDRNVNHCDDSSASVRDIIYHILLIFTAKDGHFLCFGDRKKANYQCHS